MLSNVVPQLNECELGRDSLVFHQLCDNINSYTDAGINSYTDAGLSRACAKLEESTDLYLIIILLRIIARCHATEK